jgi:Gram-negative bacterial TonB protein C-terminal
MKRMAVFLLAIAAGAAAFAQQPPEVERIGEPPAISILAIPDQNPFGKALDAAPTLPRPAMPSGLRASSALFAGIKIDPDGNVETVRLLRNPIRSLTAEYLKTLARWRFQPPTKAGQHAAAWATVEIDLAVEFKRISLSRFSVTPVLPADPTPEPFVWGTDAAWIDSQKAVTPTDGAWPVESLDAVPTPKRTPWSADSFKGPFQASVWIEISANGKPTRMVPIELPDPVLISYLRSVIARWIFTPGRIKGEPVDSWVRLDMAGQISLDDDLTEVRSIRKTLAGAQ